MFTGGLPAQFLQKRQRQAENIDDDDDDDLTEPIEPKRHSSAGDDSFSCSIPEELVDFVDISPS